MGFVLDAWSSAHLIGVHPDLVRVVRDCAQNGVMPFTFGVTEGLRSLEQQKKDLAAGKSQTLHSRHLDGHAVDLVVLTGGVICWAWPPYHVLAEQMQAAAARCNVPVEWGGDWKMRDGPHFQLTWESYPSEPAEPPPPLAQV